MLLEDTYYHSHMKPILAQWTSLWLKAHHVLDGGGGGGDAINVTEEHILKLLLGTLDRGTVERLLGTEENGGRGELTEGACKVRKKEEEGGRRRKKEEEGERRRKKEEGRK